MWSGTANGQATTRATQSPLCPELYCSCVTGVDSDAGEMPMWKNVLLPVRHKNTVVALR